MTRFLTSKTSSNLRPSAWKATTCFSLRLSIVLIFAMAAMMAGCSSDDGNNEAQEAKVSTSELAWASLRELLESKILAPSTGAFNKGPELLQSMEDPHKNQLLLSAEEKVELAAATAEDDWEKLAFAQIATQIDVLKSACNKMENVELRVLKGASPSETTSSRQSNSWEFASYLREKRLRDISKKRLQDSVSFCLDELDGGLEGAEGLPKHSADQSAILRSIKKIADRLPLWRGSDSDISFVVLELNELESQTFGTSDYDAVARVVRDLHTRLGDSFYLQAGIVNRRVKIHSLKETLKGLEEQLDGCFKLRGHIVGNIGGNVYEIRDNLGRQSVLSVTSGSYTSTGTFEVIAKRDGERTFELESGFRKSLPLYLELTSAYEATKASRDETADELAILGSQVLELRVDLEAWKRSVVKSEWLAEIASSLLQAAAEDFAKLPNQDEGILRDWLAVAKPMRKWGTYGQYQAALSPMLVSSSIGAEVRDSLQKAQLENLLKQMEKAESLDELYAIDVETKDGRFKGEVDQAMAKREGALWAKATRVVIAKISNSKDLDELARIELPKGLPDENLQQCSNAIEEKRVSILRQLYQEECDKLKEAETLLDVDRVEAKWSYSLFQTELSELADSQRVRIKKLILQDHLKELRNAQSISALEALALPEEIAEFTEIVNEAKAGRKHVLEESVLERALNSGKIEELLALKKEDFALRFQHTFEEKRDEQVANLAVRDLETGELDVEQIDFLVQIDIGEDRKVRVLKAAKFARFALRVRTAKTLRELDKVASEKLPTVYYREKLSMVATQREHMFKLSDLEEAVSIRIKSQLVDSGMKFNYYSSLAVCPSRMLIAVAFVLDYKAMKKNGERVQADERARVQLWSLESRKLVWEKACPARINSPTEFFVPRLLTFSTKGDYLLGSAKDSLWIWSSESGEIVKEGVLGEKNRTLGCPLTVLHMGNDNKITYAFESTTYGNIAYVRDLQSWRIEDKFQTELRGIERIDASQNGSLLVFVGPRKDYGNTEQPIAEVWNKSQSKRICFCAPAEKTFPKAVKFLSCGKKVAILGNDELNGKVAVFGASAGSQLATKVLGPKGWTVDVSRAGERLIRREGQLVLATHDWESGYAALKNDGRLVYYSR